MQPHVAAGSPAKPDVCRVMGEDKAVVESLKPELLPFEFSVKEDDMQKAFSSLRQVRHSSPFGLSCDSN